MRSVSILIAALVVSVGVFGCDPQQNSQLPTTGHYQGTLTRVASAKIEKLSVLADVEAEGSNGLKISMTQESGVAILPIHLSAVDSSTSEIQIEDLGKSKVQLTAESACWVSQAKNGVQVCLTPTAIKLSVSQEPGKEIYSLALEHSENAVPMPLETPQAFTVSQAVKRAFSMSFESRIEFQRSAQAKYLAKNAYQNLLPHFSLGTIATVAEMNPYSLVGAIGDLAPFLLPSRWMHAQEQSDLSDAEKYALIVMRADTGVEVEALAYALGRDKEILKAYDDTLLQVDDLQKRVQWREKFGEFPQGTADNLLTTLHSLQSDRATLALNIDEQMAFVAQSLGMINPKGVSGLTLEADSLPIEQASPLNDEQIWQPASSGSFELKQMDSLIAAAQQVKDATLFEWIDPSGDPTAALGFGMGSALEIKSSQLEQVKVSREQVQAILLQKVTQSVLEYNHALEQYAQSKQDLDLQNKRVLSTLDQLRLSNDVNLIDLATVFQDRMRAQILLSSAHAAFRIHRAKIDRLLLKGLYSSAGSSAN